MTLSTKCKVVIDTNVFISGLIFGGQPEKILDLVRLDKIKPLVSSELKEEIFAVLQENDFPEQNLQLLKELLQKTAKVIEPVNKVTICRDPKDNMFLSVALEGKADFIITGDKDLLVLKKFKKTRIVTPKEFLATR